MENTLKSATQYASQGKIEDWIRNLLLTSGNPDFAKMVKGKGYWVGPTELELHKLKRICGPEPGVIFKEDAQDWEQRLAKMQQSLREDWDMPPLLIWYKDEE